MDDVPASWIALMAAVRALHIATCMALAALWLFNFGIASGAALSTETQWRRWLLHWTRRLLPIIAIGGAAWFALACMQITDLPAGQALAPAMMLKVLTHTEFGFVCSIRLLMLLACMALTALTAFFTGRLSSFLLSAAASALLVSLAWVGHGQIGSGLHLINDAIHLGLCALWPAGLWPMFVFLKLAPSNAATFRVLRRFSAVSLIVVVLLAAAGTVNSLFMLQMPSDLVDSLYGKVLLIKIGLFLSLIGLGAVHRLRWLPSLERNPLGNGLVRLRQTMLVEMIITAIILLAVGILGTIAPPYMPGM